MLTTCCCCLCGLTNLLITALLPQLHQCSATLASLFFYHSFILCAIQKGVKKYTDAALGLKRRRRRRNIVIIASRWWGLAHSSCLAATAAATTARALCTVLYRPTCLIREPVCSPLWCMLQPNNNNNNSDSNVQEEKITNTKQWNVCLTTKGRTDGQSLSITARFAWRVTRVIVDLDRRPGRTYLIFQQQQQQQQQQQCKVEGFDMMLMPNHRIVTL